MKNFIILLALLGSPLSFADQLNESTAYPPIYTQIFNEVDRNQVFTRLKEMTGELPVTVGADTFKISERYSPKAKANFRAYWKAYYHSLGIDVQEMAYPTKYTHLEKEGHNLEAVLPGKSADSVIVIVHYDSMGPSGSETANPGVDDDMTGMATQLETARILKAHQSQLQYTVRFVAVDFEEWGGLEGSRKYAKYIQALAKTQNFKLIAGIDDEQSGWNCAREGKCKDASKAQRLLINDCSDMSSYSSKPLGLQLQSVVQAFSSIPVVIECAGQDSDHYALWEIGMPALEYGEFSWETNDHFDESGGDVYSKIDEDYFFSLSQVGVVFAATQAGLN